jgi:TolA-binding protein
MTSSGSYDVIDDSSDGDFVSEATELINKLNIIINKQNNLIKQKQQIIQKLDTKVEELNLTISKLKKEKIILENVNKQNVIRNQNHNDSHTSGVKLRKNHSFCGLSPISSNQDQSRKEEMVGAKTTSGLIDTSGSLRHVDSNYDLPRDKELTRLSRVIDDSHRHHYR